MAKRNKDQSCASLLPSSSIQWCNRQGAECPPRDFWPGNLCCPIGKKVARKKCKRGEMEKKRKKTVKGKVDNRKWKEDKVPKWGPFFLFFCFSLFKMTKICFGCTKMEIFYRKKENTPGKKSAKMTLARQY